MVLHRWQLPRGLQVGSVRAQLPWLLFAFAAALALVSLARLVSQVDIAAMDLLSDPAEVTGISWYVGAVSDLKLLVWGAGAAVHLLAAFGLRHADGHLAAAFGWLGAITVVFTLDDRFLLHEIVFPWLFGLSQITTFALYGLALAVLLVWFRRVLLGQPEACTLLLALGALGASVALDVLGWNSTDRRGAEKAAKLPGAIAWVLFPATVVVRHLDSSGHQDSSREERSR